MSETARKAEANGTSATFEFRGETFTVPTEYDDYPLDFIEAVAEGAAPVIALRGLLGPEQWEKVRATGPMKGRDVNEVVNLANSAMGLTLGNSTASSD